jgi:penicillin-binding protein 2
MQRTGRIVQPRTRRRIRGQGARVMIVMVVLFLGFSLVRLQVLASEELALVARENMMRPLVTRAPRGTVYDRHGQVVAENVVGYQVLMMPAPLDSMRAILDRLRPVIGLTDSDIEVGLRRFRRAPGLPMEVLRNADPIAVARLEERRHLFPNVLLNEYPLRHYPQGDLVAHLVGYVAEISERELELPDFEGYQQGRWIGKAGLERYHEQRIGGEPGIRYLEVDARGRIKRWLPEEVGVPAIPGQDLHLHLDLDLQRYVAELFEDIRNNPAMAHLRGDLQAAFVALEPQTGGVLALYSSPTYDPNIFTGGIGAADWQRLNEDPSRPLLERVTGAIQPPGSTFKLQVAAMALQQGVIRPDEFMPISCGGGMTYLNRYARCHLASGHGRQNLILGIQNSCNVYFYQVGIRMGLARFVETGARLGFGSPTGIDLPSEIPSFFPQDLDAWARRFGARPTENEIMSLSIGQGMVTISPLKLAHQYVALARRDGKALAPRVANTGEEVPTTYELAVDAAHLESMRMGLRRVVAPGGTAGLTRLPVWDFMGKTGTAQNPHGDSHGWFVAMGGPPGGEPEIVAALLVMHARAGSAISGMVGNAINFYLNKKHGFPFERYATPRERLPRGLSVNWQWYQSPVVDPPPLPQEEAVARVRALARQLGAGQRTAGN